MKLCLLKDATLTDVPELRRNPKGNAMLLPRVMTWCLVFFTVLTLDCRSQIAKNGTFLSSFLFCLLAEYIILLISLSISVRNNSYLCCSGSLKTVFGKQIARQRFISGVFDDKEVSQTILRNFQIRL